MTLYRVELAPSAARAFRGLSPELQRRVRQALASLARDLGQGRIPAGKSVKTIRGARDSFNRLRVGDHRVMYDKIDDDGVVLVLGIVHRRDLERWIRNR